MVFAAKFHSHWDFHLEIIVWPFRFQLISWHIPSSSTDSLASAICETGSNFLTAWSRNFRLGIWVTYGNYLLILPFYTWWSTEQHHLVQFLDIPSAFSSSSVEWLHVVFGRSGLCWHLWQSLNGFLLQMEIKCIYIIFLVSKPPSLKILPCLVNAISNNPEYKSWDYITGFGIWRSFQGHQITILLRWQLFGLQEILWMRYIILVDLEHSHFVLWPIDHLHFLSEI
jgi:hypothetical protein